MHMIRHRQFYSSAAFQVREDFSKVTKRSFLLGMLKELRIVSSKLQRKVMQCYHVKAMWQTEKTCQQ